MNSNRLPYTTRLQKGGALLAEMRTLVREWASGHTAERSSSAVRANMLGKSTRARSADVLRRAFMPRFVNGPVPNAWKIVRPLEDLDAPPALLVPLYYWITACAEPLLSDFVCECLAQFPDHYAFGVGPDDVVQWLRSKGCDWSETVVLKVARGLLAALRDFGILDGRAQKHLSLSHLPVESFSYLAFSLYHAGAAGHGLVAHRDWTLFLLRPADVERYLFEAHQMHFLQYHAAGSSVSIEFPARSFEEYARVIVEGPH